MKNSKSARNLESQADPLKPRHLDLSKAVRGKYYDRMQAGTNIVLIAPDLLDTFPDSESVNEALRGLKKIATRSARPTPRPRKSARTPPHPRFRNRSSARPKENPSPPRPPHPAPPQNRLRRPITPFEVRKGT